MKLALNPLPRPDGSPPVSPAAALDKPVLFVGRHPDCDGDPRARQRSPAATAAWRTPAGTCGCGTSAASTAPTVNDKPVKREAPLKVGDVLRVGDVSYRVGRREEYVDPALSGVISVAPSLSGGDPTAGDAPADSQSDVIPLSI